jgi:hypothetical protein
MGGWRAQAAEFPSLHRIVGGDCDPCPGADRAIGYRPGRRRTERRRIDPGLFPRLVSPGLSVVRAPCLRPRPGEEQDALPGDSSGTVAVPPLPAGVDGVSDYDQLVGDYSNPILQPWAAETVKKHGELSKAGITYGNPSNQCWPMPMPFIYKQFLVDIIQQPDRVLLIYTAPSVDVRRVRLNGRHPEPLIPSWYGDSVGHYEGDTLVIDTVGVTPDRPYAMLDLFGTPYTKSLHIVERYRLREWDDVKDAIERNKKENWLFNGDPFTNHRGQFLQLHVTIEDKDVFTTPWTATLTYVPGPPILPENVCAENIHQYYYDQSDTDVPHADKADF